MRLSIFHSTSRALREFFLVLVQGYERAPRVSQLPIIDDYIAEAVLENISSVKYKIVAKNPEYISILGAGLVPKMPGTGEGIIEQDIDEKYIYNYLHFPENNIILQDYYLSGESFIKELIDFCFEQIDRNMNYKIIDKYFYLQRFAQNKLENLLMSSDCDLQ